MRPPRAGGRVGLVMLALCLTTLPCSANAQLAVSFGSTAVPAPDGADFTAGNSQAVSATISVSSCTHAPCTVWLRSTDASISKPSGANTALDFCVSPCTGNWQPVPLVTGNNLGAQVKLTDNNGNLAATTVLFRYRLGFVSSSPNGFTPPGPPTYSLNVQFSLTN